MGSKFKLWVSCTVYFILRLAWIDVNGTTYKKGSVVVLSMDLTPTFGVVKDIIVFETDIYYLVCEVLLTDCFSHHFHAFKTCKQHPASYDICKQTDLYDHAVLSAYTILSQPNFLFIPLKYQLVERV